MSASFTDQTRFDGKVVLITGGSSGLGAAMAEGFAGQGADLVVSGRRMDRLEQTAAAVEKLGRRCLPVQADVSSPEDCERLAEAAIEEFGRLDVLINNAGIGTANPMTREKPEDFRQVIDINLNGTYWMSQSAARRMKPGSNIINISSVLATTSTGLPQGAYTASKAAVIGLARDLAVQLTGRKGIRVNAIQPGYFPSEMTDAQDADFLKRVADRAPAGRLGESSELVNAAIFLASDAASYITGVSLPVDGGLLLN
ncbi:NAD(P)-dependent dehydrogenase (short-subunit alcohol dehydrogenase family) [Antricoccus suffuscus]|uniref:NAD(P)-dependent dehydrogenase (Short-subunit alcohol dehydrogenase family) n=1 Tax=Antricoccus suffuscus TaxID=1629062 RepID=A0A2T1A1N3_9ACTN|nr:3-oxoacyl-ACP reductase family protein [Antricoccus suffuscus]PRZ42407.1 NAD(P)-dependent dehydrogenase (short-subunit alcohol dehydrogenase family) [Antricoccus suffuscus]